MVGFPKREDMISLIYVYKFFFFVGSLIYLKYFLFFTFFKLLTKLAYSFCKTGKIWQIDWLRALPKRLIIWKKLSVKTWPKTNTKNWVSCCWWRKCKSLFYLFFFIVVHALKLWMFAFDDETKKSLMEMMFIELFSIYLKFFLLNQLIK